MMVFVLFALWVAAGFTVVMIMAIIDWYQGYTIQVDDAVQFAVLMCVLGPIGVGLLAYHIWQDSGWGKKVLIPGKKSAKVLRILRSD